jgi:hypothetical protein
MMRRRFHFGLFVLGLTTAFTVGLAPWWRWRRSWEYAAAVRDAIKHRFSEAHEKRQAAGRSVAHGREYVEAYVQLTQFVESVDHRVADGASHTHRESGEAQR